MRGQEILVRTLGRPADEPDKYGNRWQYHPRSDRHSKLACWVTLFDLMGCCPLFRRHVEAAAVGFGINHEMRDFRTGRKKHLDLVISTAGPKPAGGSSPQSFADLANTYEIALTDEEKRELDSLPPLKRVSVGTVHLALGSQGDDDSTRQGAAATP